MTNEQKRTKVLAMAGSHGVPLGLYASIVAELKNEGIIEMRDVFYAGGNRGFRYFLTQAEAAR